MVRMTKKIHMVGIGGAGMCPLAEVLLSRGHCVTGSDRSASEATRHLEGKGVKIQCGHEIDLVKNADLLVYSSAIASDNAEREYAEKNGIAQMRRAEVLGDVMRSSFTVCVSGTHGKTTTTSLVGTVLTDAEFSPTVLVGGMLKSAGSHAIVGKGNVIVAEADEYDRSFLAMYPSIAIITNIEADHLDCYSGIDDIKDTFVKFTELVGFDGAVVACIDDVGVRDILPRIRRSVITYGIDDGADYKAVDIRVDKCYTKFNVVRKGKKLGEVSMLLFGMHNVRNALAAIATAYEMGVDIETIKKSIIKFQGVKRRFEIVGEVNGVTVVDDYAHHPGEISATIEAARGLSYKKIVAVFQPHLYSRTRDFMDDFASALGLADSVIVTDIYKAREKPIEGVEAGEIVKRINGLKDLKETKDLKDIKDIKDIKETNESQKAIYVEDKNNISQTLCQVIDEDEKNVCTIFMGAGDIWECARDYVNHK